MSRKTKLFAALAAAFAMQAVMAAEVDFHGYLRSGEGSSTKGGALACFQANNANPVFNGDVYRAGRLGNECDTYGELALGANLGEAEGVGFKLHTLVAYGTDQVADYEQSVPAWREDWVEATNVFGSASVWAGKRYYKRHDVHIDDFFYQAVTGPGAGVEGLDAGVGKLSVALLREGNANYASGAPAGVTDPNQLRSTIPGDVGSAYWEGDVRLEGVDVGLGSLDFTLDLTSPNMSSGHKGQSGWAGTVQWNTPTGGLGGFNAVILQTAHGSAALDGSVLSWDSNNTGATQDIKHDGWRVMDHFVFEPKGSPVNGAFFAGYGRERFAWFTDTNGNEKYLTAWTLGFRPEYHFNDVWSLAGELGTTHSQAPSWGAAGGADYHINKETIALQLAAGKSFWARPVIRAYYTMAQWNNAAGAVASTGRDLAIGLPQYANATSGGSFGLQMEAWW